MFPGKPSPAVLVCRPYGTASLLAVYDDDGPQLYLIEPSGAGHVRPADSLMCNSPRGCTSQPTRLHASCHASTCRWVASPVTSGLCGLTIGSTGNEEAGDCGDQGFMTDSHGVPEAGYHVQAQALCMLSDVVLARMQRFFGTALGKGRQAAKTEIERLKLREIACDQGINEVAKMCACRLLHPDIPLGWQRVWHVHSNRSGSEISAVCHQCNHQALLLLEMIMEVMRCQALPACHTTSLRRRDCITALWRARSLHSVHDEEKPFEMELAWICEASGREFKRVPAELAAAAERQAKAALADSDMCALNYTRLLSAGSLHA